MRTFKFISLLLPLVGACMMAALIWKSLFIVRPITQGSYMWVLVLLMPFFLCFLSILKSARVGERLSQSVGLVHAILLGAPVAIGLIEGWNGEVIALLPIYLWPLTVIMTLAGIVADALESNSVGVLR
jgi:hypothetical protein